MNRNKNKSNRSENAKLDDYTIIPITTKQRDYIKILSSYPSTKDADEADIREYLGKVRKTGISELSKGEASDLIKILLQRPTEYTFPCGKKANLPKKEVNSYNVLGWLEGCLHSCPDNINVNSCDYLAEHEDQLQQDEENES